ncbi:TetR/AcrR family transcriptional regulator [Ornithinimicrobium avium]|nr:TetR/AcrR family transcriptional regulator [Ornithinimicrobium avium]
MGETSLREVKRAATRRALARTTYEMVLERGLDDVTVDEVTSAVQLSRRTFSNYFAGKEEAVAEVLVLTVQDGLAGWTTPAGGDLLTGVRSLVEHQFAGDLPNVLASFRRLCADHPQLVPFWNDALWRTWSLAVGHLRSTVRPGGDGVDADLAMVTGAVYGVVSRHFGMAAEEHAHDPGAGSLDAVVTGLTRVLARLEVALGPEGDAAVRAAETAGGAEIARRAR